MLGLEYKWIQVVRSARNPASKSSSGTKSLIRFRLVLSERSEPPSDSWVTELVSSSQCLLSAKQMASLELLGFNFKVYAVMTTMSGSTEEHNEYWLR